MALVGEPPNTVSLCVIFKVRVRGREVGGGGEVGGGWWGLKRGHLWRWWGAGCTGLFQD